MAQDPDIKEIKNLEDEIASLRSKLLELKQGACENVIDKDVILNSINDMIAFYGAPNLEICWANKTSAQSIGKTVDEIIGLHCYEIWQNSSSPCPNCPVVRAFETGKYHMTNHYDAYGRCWELKAVPYFDESGNLVGVTEYGHDITEEVKAQQKIIEHRNMLASIAENSPDTGLFLFDKDLRFIFASGQAMKKLGFKSEEIIGKKVDDIFSFEQADNIKSHFLKCFVGDISYFEFEHNKYYFEIKTAPIYDDSNNIKNGMCIALDNTYKKSIELSLKESEEKYRTIFNNAPLGVFRSTIDGKFIEVNPELAKILGYDSPEEVLKNINNISEDIYVSPSKRNDIVDETISDRNIKHYENIYKRKNGEHFYAHLYLQDIKDINGNTIYLEGIVEDITERKEKEEALRKSEAELKKAIETKDRFFDIIAHDLRSPISGILGMSEIVSQQFDDLTFAELKEISKAFYESSDNLYKLLDNLLQWTRLSKERISFKPEDIRPWEALDDILNLQAFLIRNKNINIENNINKDIILTVDKNALKTVFRNIISNAIKFCQKSGNIKIHSILDDDKGIAEFIFRDDGIGMDEKTLNNLFKPEKRASRKGTMGESGTGLGLMLCKEFVKKSGGNIKVESTPEEGTTVIIKLPYRKY